MSRAFVQQPETVTVDLPNNGGMVRSGSDQLYAPEVQLCTQTGVSFGPLKVATPGVLTLNHLTFLPSDDGGVLSVFTAGALAAGVPDDGEEIETDVEPFEPDWDDDPNTIPAPPKPTRRGLLTALGAIVIAAAYGSTTVSAQDDGEETVALHFAEFDISSIDAPVSVSILDQVQGVLPPSTDVLIDQEATRVGEIVSSGEDVELLQETGTVKVYLRGSRSQLAQLIAWVKSWLPRDESLTYRRTLPDDRLASDFDEGEFVRLTSHPAIVGPIQNSGSDETILEIGNTTIPHSDDGSNEFGAWDTFDDGSSLIYIVGTNPPASEVWQVTTRLQAWQTLL